MVIDGGFAERERERVGELYWAAFGDKLSPAFRDCPTGARIVAESLRADRMLVARISGEVVGVCGYYEDGRGAADLSWSLLRRRLPRAAALRSLVLLAILARPGRPGTLILDGICVDGAHRGRGIGSALLGAAAAHARRRGSRAVQLSVVDANPRAAALYRRVGFTATGRGTVGPLGRLYGFRRYTTMQKQVDE
ncbi:GNAT family N-acetyltransferase [Leucobacter weissii]|nr:GNAT family N-acetyltransferase [Leucobacter weissii]